MPEALLLHPWTKALIYEGIVVLGLGQEAETASHSLSKPLNLLMSHVPTKTSLRVFHGTFNHSFKITGNLQRKMLCQGKADYEVSIALQN